jgi:Radical SAM superfamily
MPRATAPATESEIETGATHATSARRRFRIVLIKPSHYDDDGYVIRWWRNFMPSNSLASVYAIAKDCAERAVLGPDVEIVITATDETNRRVRVDRIIADFKRDGNFGLVGMVGVQSNQYPRTLDIIRPLRAAGIPVVIGGFHVSGMLAMFPTVMADLQEALDMGASLFTGEAEGRVETLIHDAAKGALKPLYNFVNDLPGLEGSTVPFLPRNTVQRTLGKMTTFDAGRGCPYQCSFCTIINVQGRKSRKRTPDDVENIIRRNLAQGIDRFFITDDNFARNKDWEAIFDRMIELRERDGLDLGFMIQVDTLCHKIPNFIEKAKRAGVTRIFIGLENINPDNLIAAKKRQNKITEYRTMMQAWKKVGIWSYAGYIIGFPNDTPESVRHDIEIVKRELPVDMLEFFILTPLPGSEDHKVLWTKGIPMDADLNNYETEHVVTVHPKMTREEWQGAYHEAWKSYYTPEHMETILRRARATGIKIFGLFKIMALFTLAVKVENVHPLQSGVIRLLHPHERRPGLPVESAWVFYPRFALHSLAKIGRLVPEFWRLWRMYRRVATDPTGMSYTDLALTPVAEDDVNNLEMFTQNKAAREAVGHARKVKELTSAA